MKGVKVHKKECELQGVDPKKIRDIANKIGEAMRELGELDLVIFGGTWSVSIRGDDELILADITGCTTTGGCGAAMKDDQGYLRGE